MYGPEEIDEKRAELRKLLAEFKKAEEWLTLFFPNGYDPSRDKLYQEAGKMLDRIVAQMSERIEGIQEALGRFWDVAMEMEGGE